MKEDNYYSCLDKLKQGHEYGIFIDDTGSPGITNPPANYHPGRKSWVAVVIPPHHIAEVLDQMPMALSELKRLIGADEFHFTDIYSGKNQYKNVDLQLRLKLFEFMAHIFSKYEFPILVQTIDPDSLADAHLRSGYHLPDSFPPFDFAKSSDFALFMLLIRVKLYLKSAVSFTNNKACVFIDEGFRKAGAVLHLPSFNDVFVDGLVCFSDSSSLYPIQLADFAAFSLNRSQLVGGRAIRSSLDSRFLEILEPIVFNYINIEKKVSSFGQEGPLIKPIGT